MLPHFPEFGRLEATNVTGVLLSWPSDEVTLSLVIPNRRIHDVVSPRFAFIKFQSQVRPVHMRFPEFRTRIIQVARIFEEIQNSVLSPIATVLPQIPDEEAEGS